MAVFQKHYLPSEQVTDDAAPVSMPNSASRRSRQGACRRGAGGRGLTLNAANISTHRQRIGRLPGKQLMPWQRRPAFYSTSQAFMVGCRGGIGRPSQQGYAVVDGRRFWTGPVEAASARGECCECCECDEARQIEHGVSVPWL